MAAGPSGNEAAEPAECALQPLQLSGVLADQAAFSLDDGLLVLHQVAVARGLLGVFTEQQPQVLGGFGSFLGEPSLPSLLLSQEGSYHSENSSRGTLVGLCESLLEGSGRLAGGSRAAPGATGVASLNL